MHQASAAGRTALIEAGAVKPGAKPADCTALAGVVSGGGKTVTYARIVARGLNRTFPNGELAAVPLKPQPNIG